MKDIFLYIQIAVFAMNVVVFIYLMQTEKYQYKFARITLLILLSAGMLVNIGKLTFLTVLFTLSTYLSLFKFNPNGNISRIIEKFRGNSNRGNEHLQRVQGTTQRHRKTLLKQKA